jgi:hypothetical protein
VAKSIDIWLVENKALMKVAYKSLGATFSVELDGACGKKGIGAGPHIRAAFQDAVAKYNKSACWHYSASLTKCVSGEDDYGCSWSSHYYKCNDCGAEYVT